MVTTIDIAWVAGLVEGEGALGWTSRKHPRISVAMKDRDVIERLAALWHCTVRTKRPRPEHWSTLYKAQVNGRHAIGWGMTLYRFLGLRRRTRVREMIEAWTAKPRHKKHVTACPAGHPYADGNVRWSVRPSGQRYRSCRACCLRRSRAYAVAHPDRRHVWEQTYRARQRVAVTG